MDTHFFKVVTSAEFKELLGSFPSLDEEECGLAEAAGRVQASDVTSPEDLPPADRSCMDGYAVRAADLYGASESSPAYLECAAELAIDDVPDLPLEPGRCMAITTGGRLPQGADAVAMVEHTERMGGETVEFHKSVPPGGNVMLRGEDVARGDAALSAGRRLRPQDVGLLAALGVTRLPVRKRPSVALLSTGDELVPPEATPRPGQIRDVNTATLSALLEHGGYQVRPLPIVGDDLGELVAAMRSGLEENDLLFVSGGSSVGTRDLTIRALMELPGAEVLVHGVQVSPGKPTILARAMDKIVWGLPGQVTSSQVVMRVFGLPFLRHLEGERDAFDPDSPPRIRAELARNLASKPGREDHVRVRLQARDNALPLAHPVTGKSGLLKTLLAAHGLITIPHSSEGLEAGTGVAVRSF